LHGHGVEVLSCGLYSCTLGAHSSSVVLVMQTLKAQGWLGGGGTRRQSIRWVT
jgi:hypothetical protein